MSATNQPSVGKNSSTTSEVSLANSSEIDCLGEERIESDDKSLQKKFNVHFLITFLKFKLCEVEGRNHC